MYHGAVLDFLPTIEIALFKDVLKRAAPFNCIDIKATASLVDGHSEGLAILRQAFGVILLT